MVYITRREHFNAAHKLHRADWSEEKNKEIFGPCANPNWHGHNYELFVTVKGKPGTDTGFVINLKSLSDVIRKEIVDKVDHKNFNLDVDFMKGILPSAENIAVAFWKILDKHVTKLGATLHCVKLKETENNYVEYFGE
jgi:6-pyruvoyltetrahydropterin/6-carboxytetrahydropterin synthase